MTLADVRRLSILVDDGRLPITEIQDGAIKPQVEIIPVDLTNLFNGVDN